MRSDIRFSTPPPPLPTNDSEAEECLRWGRNPFAASCLFGIYRCNRGEGMTVLDAYEATLRAHLEIAKGDQPSRIPDQGIN